MTLDELPMKCTVRFSIHVTRNKRIVATVKATIWYASVSRPVTGPACVFGERPLVPSAPWSILGYAQRPGISLYFTGGPDSKCTANLEYIPTGL